jgi:hypothetical protein
VTREIIIIIILLSLSPMIPFFTASLLFQFDQLY